MRPANVLEEAAVQNPLVSGSIVQEATVVPRSVRVFVALFALGVFCSGCGPKVSSGDLSRFHELDAGAAHARQLRDLDPTADGKIDAQDASFFAKIAAKAAEELRRRGGTIDAHDALYHGPPEPKKSLFGLVHLDGQLSTQKLNDEQLRALAIETAWLSRQAQMAAIATDGKQLERPFSGLFAEWVPGYNPTQMAPADVCLAAEGLDIDALAEHGVPATAVFDLDSTVWQGDVMEPFIASLLERGWVSPKAQASLAKTLEPLDGVDPTEVESSDALENAKLLFARWRDKSLPDSARPSAKDMFYLIVEMMQGLTREQGFEAAQQAIEQGAGGLPPWHSRIFADSDGCDMKRIIELLQQRGVEVYLLSATLDVLAEQAARSLGIPKERVLGSPLELSEGVYTGRVADSTYYSKGAIVRQWLEAPPLLVFGDSARSDFAMLLEAAGAGFMINPNADLLERDVAEAASRLVAVEFDATRATVAATESSKQ